MHNVFQIGGQVSGDSFIGRNDVVIKIRESFLEQTRASKAVIGLTRIGKTSAIRNSFLDLPDNIAYIYEDLNEWSSYSELWQDICLEIHSYLKMNKNSIDEDLNACFQSMENENQPWIKMNRNIKKIFAYLSDKNIKTILVLDEFDNASMLFGQGDQSTKHYELFRTIISDGRYNVSAITISRRNLYTIEGSTYQSSTFHGVFDIFHFKGFNEADMQQYFDVFETQGILLDESQKEKIIYYAGNMPYLLSILGHYIIDTAENQESIDIDQIFLNKCKAINDYYRDCIKHLERDNDLKRIIPFIIGPNIGVTRGDKEELFNLGYFREEKGSLVAISEYFTDFLSNEKLQIDIWDNVINLEKKLKLIIEREFPKMMDHFEVGGKNVNEIQKNILKRVDRSAISRYETFIANNKKTFHKDSTYFDVMSLADAVKIIRNCWADVFSPYFDNNPYSDWDHKFSKCAWARNPIAHGHEEYLTDADKKEIDAYCKMTFDILTKTIGSIRADNRSFLDVAKKYNNIAKRNGLDNKQPETASHNNNNTLNSVAMNKQNEAPKNHKINIPNGNLIGKRTDMKVLNKGSNWNLTGIVEGNYSAVIPKNYLFGKPLDSLIGKCIPVEIVNMNNGLYQAKPIWKDIRDE